MVNITRYGMISDIHADPRIIVPTLEVLKKEGAQRLLVNGDIGGRMGSLEESQQYTAFILGEIAESGFDTYVQPGSHETVEGFHPVLSQFAQNSPNIKNVFDNRRVEQGDHDLVFIPGSDFLCGGQYQIGDNDEMETGLYDTKNGPMFYENMNDLKRNVRDPKNTIVVCHVPRKFDNLETAVDMAEFGEATEDFELQRNKVKKGSVFPGPVAEKIAEAGYPVTLKKENRGNEDLGRVYDELQKR
jgi:Icc-related predicted phosphoesterase